MDSDFITYHCQPISRLIYFAYSNSVSNYNVPVGYPAWAETDRYEFTAKVAERDVTAWQNLTLDQRRVVMRSVLADVVKLKMRLDTTPQPVYLLEVEKRGPKLTPYNPGDKQKLPDGRVQEGRGTNYFGVMTYFQAESMGDLAVALTAHLDRTVVDRTNLKGLYTFKLPMLLSNGVNPHQHAPWDEDSPSTAEGLGELGLKLRATKVPIERLMLDHIERPEEN